MRDYRKFCRPKIEKYPSAGDILVKLKCGSTGVMSQREYKKVKRFFKSNSFVGETSDSAGKVRAINKELGTIAVFNAETYDLVKDQFDIQEIINDRKNLFDLHEFLDLGLPSGTLWATMNVGATSVTGTGTFYKFGETTSYDGTDYNVSTYTDKVTTNLPLEDDAANVNWGGECYIPTKTLWTELVSNTTHTIILNYDNTGTNVVKFAKIDDSSTFIILPMIGSYTNGELKNPTVAYYWASTQRNGSADYALFSESYTNPSWGTAFGHGMLVRAVCDSEEEYETASIGDIICYNSILDRQAIFSYEDWITLDDSWEAIGLYDIDTYEEDDELTETRDVILANGTTFIIKDEDYSKVSDHWEIVDTLSIPEEVPDWIEIGGIKWATRLLGAESPGEEGDLYQWGNVESGGEYVEDNQYYQFTSYSDQYGNYEGYGYSKYNSTDNKTVLEENDDPATYNLGSNWRTPTIEEFLSLINNTTVEFSNDLFVYTDKLDPSKKLYIPLYNKLMSSTLGNYYNNGDDFITNLVLNSYHLESNCCCVLSPDTDLDQIHYSGYECLRFCLFYVLPVYVGEGE